MKRLDDPYQPISAFTPYQANLFVQQILYYLSECALAEAEDFHKLSLLEMLEWCAEYGVNLTEIRTTTEIKADMKEQIDYLSNLAQYDSEWH